MKCSDIISKIEEVFPKQYAMSWDNVGLLVGRKEKEVRNIYVALDVTEKVLEDAISFHADMIVTHHPLLFSPVKRITDDDFIGRRIQTLIQNDISYYAMHTNYDVVRMGEGAAIRLQLEDVEVLEQTSDDGKGIGVIGIQSGICTVESFCERVKSAFEIPYVKVFGNMKKQVKKVAICPGSGKSVIPSAISKGADVLLTGDIDHHTGIDAVACGLQIVDAGHYGLEHIFMQDMEMFLSENILEVQVKSAPLQHPFQIC